MFHIFKEYLFCSSDFPRILKSRPIEANDAGTVQYSLAVLENNGDFIHCTQITSGEIQLLTITDYD